MASDSPNTVRSVLQRLFWHAAGVPLRLAVLFAVAVSTTELVQR